MSEIKGFYTAEQLALDVASIIYNQGKAQIFNILESQIENETRQFACKRLVQTILTNIGKDVKQLIANVLGDWQEEVSVDSDSVLTGSEKEEAKKEYREDVERFTELRNAEFTHTYNGKSKTV